MNKTGPIVVIEDDPDDQEIIRELFRGINLTNELVILGDSELALEYLTSPAAQPFLVLSDINMPKLNGFQLRDKVILHNKLKLKNTPYLFFSTSKDQFYVQQAFESHVHGYFLKPASLAKFRQTLEMIVEYWYASETPELEKAMYRS